MNTKKSLPELLKENLPNTIYLRQSQLIPNVLPFSAATLWRKVRAGEFPKPIKLSKRITAWSYAEVIEWIQSRYGETTST